MPALWGERRRLTGMIALSILLPEIPWNVGYFTRLVTGRELFGLSDYMFDRRKPLWLQALSLFHVWLPGLALWSVRRLGCDPRAFMLAGEAVLLASYTFTRPEKNVNWVYGPGNKPQKKIPRGLYLCGAMIFFPVCIWWPTHRILERLCRRVPTSIPNPRSPPPTPNRQTAPTCIQSWERSNTRSAHTRAS